MCLYPKLIKNRKYIPNIKNGGHPPIPTDERVLWVPVGCTKCMECKKQKARAWSIRLQEEIRNKEPKQFVTLTFSNESIQQLSKEIEGIDGYERDNELATIAVRRFLERWRKKYKTSVKHWLVTELGHNGTENIHMHGIIWTDQKEDIKQIWGYGYVYIGDYVNDKTVNYCVKYSTKTDLQHKEYNAKILTSPGIGKNYTNRIDAGLNRYKINGETNETYKTRQGQKINLPIYWRNKIYTEDQREQLWLQKLDKKERWVDGQRVDIAKGEETYYKLLESARRKNKRLGYGTDEENWQRKYYEITRRNLLHRKRTETLETLHT
ncbi:MAG: replication initiator protein [Microviridae sp.]|nr:MAG: replication initiator protein [Microviridae sp.]